MLAKQRSAQRNVKGLSKVKWGDLALGEIIATIQNSYNLTDTGLYEVQEHLKGIISPFKLSASMMPSGVRPVGQDFK